MTLSMGSGLDYLRRAGSEMRVTQSSQAAMHDCAHTPPFFIACGDTAFSTSVWPRTERD